MFLSELSEQDIYTRNGKSSLYLITVKFHFKDTKDKFVSLYPAYISKGETGNIV